VISLIIFTSAFGSSLVVISSVSGLFADVFGSIDDWASVVVSDSSSTFFKTSNLASASVDCLNQVSVIDLLVSEAEHFTNA